MSWRPRGRPPGRSRRCAACGPVHQGLVVADQGAALAAGDALAAVEAEGGQVCQAPRRAALVGGSGRAGGVLHQPQRVPVGDGPEPVVVGRLAHQVDREDPDGARRDQGLDRGRVDGADVGADVGEDGSGSGPDDGVPGRGEGVVGDDDLVTGAGAEHLQTEVQGGAAVGGGQRVRGARHEGELLLEGDARGPGAGQPPGLEHRADRVELGLTDGGLAQGNGTGLACRHAGASSPRNDVETP